MSELMPAYAIPPHVPPNLVMDFPLAQGNSSYENGFVDIIPKIHAEYPEIFYARDALAGNTPAWVLRRAEDLRRVYLDTEHFSSHGLAPFALLLQQDWSMVPLEIDPPLHGHYRAMMNSLFLPKAILRLEEKIRDYARTYIARFKDKGSCEFMKEFAFEYPIVVVLELLGLPQSMVTQFLEWEHGLLHEPDIQKIAGATGSVARYLRGVIADRRINPGNDVLSFATTASVDGRAMIDDELLGFAFTLFAGGLDTVATTLGNMFRCLAENPSLQQRLRDEPGLIPDAIEELLRIHSPSTTNRTCIKPTTIKGISILPGDRVLMSTTLGSLDPIEFPQPNEVIIGRERKERHLGFGYGIHRCIGVHLARTELRIAFEELLDALPQFHIQPDAKILSYLANVIQIDNLPLAWDANL